jgi:hypothetical protein
MTSQERTCAAYGLGYRRKNAKETIDHGSLEIEKLDVEKGGDLASKNCLLLTHSYKKDCEKNFMGNDPGVYAKNAVGLSSEDRIYFTEELGGKGKQVESRVRLSTAR